MRTKSLWALGLALGVGVFAADASACGGCFHPPQAVDSIVTGHRMAFAVSENRTVLWDQIRYTGQPTDFAWVLPIAPGAYIESSTDAWFEALDAATLVHVDLPEIRCVTERFSGIGCGGVDTYESASGSNFRADPGVTVVHRGTVGPYDTVTLSAASGQSLRTWLDTNGYVVPPEIDPVVDTYVAEGADFIALRLAPGRGVDQMTPVRVVTPSGPPILPLRMVAAGTGNFVDIVLYVIGEGRYLLEDLTESKVDLGALSFDLLTNDSNYATLRESALGQNDGFSFLTAFARLGAFSQAAPRIPGLAPGFRTSNFGYTANTLAELYFAQAAENAFGSPYSSCSATLRALSDDRVVTQQSASSSELGSDTFTCDTSYTDLAAAMIGLHPNRVWLSRLEMTLPREALGMDCNVGLSGSQTPVSNILQAVKVTNRDSSCQEPLFESRLARTKATSAEAFGGAALSIAAALVLRRLRGRRR